MRKCSIDFCGCGFKPHSFFFLLFFVWHISVLFTKSSLYPFFTKKIFLFTDIPGLQRKLPSHSYSEYLQEKLVIKLGPDSFRDFSLICFGVRRIICLQWRVCRWSIETLFDGHFFFCNKCTLPHHYGSCLNYKLSHNIINMVKVI